MGSGNLLAQYGRVNKIPDPNPYLFFIAILHCLTPGTSKNKRAFGWKFQITKYKSQTNYKIQCPKVQIINALAGLIMPLEYFSPGPFYLLPLAIHNGPFFILIRKKYFTEFSTFQTPSQISVIDFR